MGSVLSPPGFEHLTDKQTAFAKAYISNGFNASEAARSAGYSARTAFRSGQENMQNHAVKTLIRALQADALSKNQITPEMVIRELGRLALADPRKAYRWFTDEETGKTVVHARDSDTLDDDTAATIAGVKLSEKGVLEFKHHPKVDALRTLAQHFGLLAPDAVQQTAVTFVISGGPPLMVDKG